MRNLLILLFFGRTALYESSSSSEYYHEDEQHYDTDDDRYTQPDQNKIKPKPSKNNNIKPGSNDFPRDYSGDTTGSDNYDDDVFPNSISQDYNAYEYQNQKLSHVLNDGNDARELGDERNDGDDDGSQKSMKLSGVTTFGDGLYDANHAGGLIHGKNKSKAMGTGNPTDLLAKQEMIYEKKERKNEDDTILDPDFDKSEEENEVNYVEYKDDCPKACPVRDKMICARIPGDGTRYNFFSFCELRRYQCHRPEKKVELVSRNPCLLMSSMIIQEVNNGTWAYAVAPPKLSDPADEDPVLKYIRCRELGRTERDPRCQLPV